MVRVALNRRQEGREEEAGLVEKGETDGWRVIEEFH